MLTTACCLVVGLGLGLDYLVSGWLVVMHTYPVVIVPYPHNCDWQGKCLNCLTPSVRVFSWRSC